MSKRAERIPSEERSGRRRQNAEPAESANDKWYHDKFTFEEDNQTRKRERSSSSSARRKQ